MSQGILAAVLIYGITLLAACLAIWLLKSKPVRIAAVIAALATLVAALVPAVKVLVQDNSSPPADVVAPKVPGQATLGASTPPTEPTDTSNASPSTDKESK
ncbi:hypothetical protein [Streptomyces sp. TP-A0356]|uniref:hypothetical protein n=1 Tax=Streptomyces sp. TP-A0356 TaxID=1359208 RepID=UPI0006E25744|nr:hypothetical protein [Streptomyces sp. TP-A0356]